MISRREFIAGSLAIATASRTHPARPAKTSKSIVVNDVHSGLNSTRVLGILEPRSAEDVQNIIRKARNDGNVISVSGGRHAMGGQQFGTDTLLIDIRGLDRVIHLDRDRGIIEVESGIQWPELIKAYLELQNADRSTWGIAQKQTGADRLTVAGTIAANAHGRGLTMKPFVSDVESLVLVDSMGTIRNCSRSENPELFRLVNGGYGLFGIVTCVKLRLVPRTKLERVVELRSVEGLIAAFDKRISEGFRYGDFQFAIQRDSEDFLHKGVLSCYRPVPLDTRIPGTQRELSDDNWKRLLYLAHSDPEKAFEKYSEYYLSTNGQIYWSDTHQLSIYPANYHHEIDRKTHAPHSASEIITEVNVPRQMLKGFFDEVRDDFRKHEVKLVYGTVRLSERDDDSFLPWAKESYACVIFNLHTVHTSDGLKHSAGTFRRLIDMASRRGGTYFLTYHRFAYRDQVLSCYPQITEFLRMKRKYDPEERFQSDWYRHYKTLFADSLC